MNKRSNAIVVGGVLVAMLGMLLVFVYARSVKAEAGLTAGGTAFVATTDIPVGTRWEDMSSVVKRESIDGDRRPANAVANHSQLNGRTSARAISKGEVVTTNQFNASASGGLDIPAGQNAITINLSIPAGVGRYVQTGSTTNVYVTFKGLPGTNPQESVLTKLLLTNIKVLANRPAVPAGEENPSSTNVGAGDVLLTLAVTPEQSEKLIFAKENGSLWFGLINPGDAPVTTTGRTYRSALV
jgi:pilus assembly protein CpaB